MTSPATPRWKSDTDAGSKLLAGEKFCPGRTTREVAAHGPSLVTAGARNAAQGSSGQQVVGSARLGLAGAQINPAASVGCKAELTRPPT